MNLEIIVHNVGHGQAIHAFTPNGQTIVIDLGSSDDFSPLKWLRSKTTRIDSLVITHPHEDHIREVLELERQGLEVVQLWRPKWLTESDIRAQNRSSASDVISGYLALSNRMSAPIPPENLVGNPAVSGGVTLKEFVCSTCATSNINNHSGVVVLKYLTATIVIPGDNESPSWTEIANESGFLTNARKPDIMVASHHGRDSGYFPELFDEQRGIGKPKLCVVSDGCVVDTDARDRYSYHAEGWQVHSRSGQPPENRFCLTTRADGYVEIEVGKNPNNHTFVQVTAN